LTDGVAKCRVELESENGRGVTVSTLIQQLARTVIQERPELFCSGDSVRPGVLVLVNDADWELDGGKDRVLADGDSVIFISTLHGG